MSNFPIIPTTPPPLEGNESEDEEEPEFRTFNDVNEEKDIDFVIPDFTTYKELEAKTSTHLNDKTTYEDKQKCEQIDDRFVQQKDINFCDNEFDNEILSEKDPETIGSNLEINGSTVDSNENNLESNQNHMNSVLIDDIIEKSMETEMNVTEELSDFNVNTDDNDFDFADFTSYQTTEVIENVKQNEEILNENQSFDLNNFDNSFGDFNDSFQTNFDAINETKNNENPLNNNNESDDDFADFASAEPVVSTEFESVSNFNSNTNQLETDENDDGFADFASFQDNSYVENTTLHSNSSVNQMENLTKLFAQVFPNTHPIDSIDNSPNISRDLFNTADQNSKSLWKHLQDLESAPSLKLKWSTSHSFQLVLAALNIDPRNILRNPSVPMFASGLGCVLEPTKPKFNDDLSDEMETENSNGLIPNSIPPVHFDWSSSGLTNPLDSNQKTMVAFDLDFFVTNDDVKNTTKQTGISNFEEELLNNKIENTCDSHIVHKNNLMEQILSSVANTSSKSMQKTNGSQVLSAEALQVLDELPNLSFLTAKVLMFPINIKTKP